MIDEELSVSFRDAEVGHMTDLPVTRAQAQAILTAKEGDRVLLGAGRWVQLQPSSEFNRTERVYHYHHGQPGGHGYVQAREADLRTELRRVLLLANHEHGELDG